MESHGKELPVRVQQLSLCKESDFELFTSTCMDLIDSGVSCNVLVCCCCDFNRDISDLGVSGTLGYLLSDLMSLRKLYCLRNFL